MKNIKIGIVTLFNCYNYGAVLQSFATYEYLKELGFINVEIVNYENKYESTMKKTLPYIFMGDKKDILKKFIQFFIFGKNRHLKRAFSDFTHSLEKSKIQYKDFNDLKTSKYDILISGSDQIWNPVIFKKIDYAYFLEFSDSAKKISISSSAGSYKYTTIEKEKISKCLNKYSAISVRENSLKEQIKDLVQRDIFVSVDPTLLLSKKQWKIKLKGKNRYNEENSDYALLYIVDSNLKNYEKEISILKNKLNLPIWIITPYRYKMKNIDRNIVYATPNDFISLFDNANYILTNSYHGVIFSTNFQKKFIALENHKNPTRTRDYLSKLELTDRIVKNCDDATNIMIDFDNYSYINKLNFFVNETKKWIGEKLIEKY